MEVLLKLRIMAISGAHQWAIETIHHLVIIIVVEEKGALFTLRYQIMALLKTLGVGDVSSDDQGHEKILPIDVCLTNRVTSIMLAIIILRE